MLWIFTSWKHTCNLFGNFSSYTTLVGISVDSSLIFVKLGLSCPFFSWGTVRLFPLFSQSQILCRDCFLHIFLATQCVKFLSLLHIGKGIAGWRICVPSTVHCQTALQMLGPMNTPMTTMQSVCFPHAGTDESLGIVKLPTSYCYNEAERHLFPCCLI